MKLTTDNKWKNFKYRYEVPEKVLKEQFSHLEDEIDGFIKYRENWYHTSDFMRIESIKDFAGYDGYLGDSFFLGIVIKLSSDGERYKIATYIS